MRIGTPELLLTLLIVVILFGPSQIPKLMKLCGKGVKGFRDGLNAAGTETDPDDGAADGN